MDAKRLAMSGALVPAESEPHLIATSKQKSIRTSIKAIRSAPYTSSQKRYAAKPTLKQLTSRIDKKIISYKYFKISL